MNGATKLVLLIAGVSTLTTVRAGAQTSAGGTITMYTTPAGSSSTLDMSGLSSTEQGYVQMGTAEAQQQVQTINANSTPVPSTYQPTGSGSAGTAKSANTMQLLAVGASVAAAGYLATKCFAPTPAKWACPMMLLAVAQAGMSLASAGGSAKSADEFATSGGYGTGGTGTGNGYDNTMGGGTMGANGGPGSSGNGAGSNLQQMAANDQMGKLIGEYQGLRSSLEKSGYQISADGKTITDPSGRQIPSSAFQNPNAAAGALGLSDAEAQAMNDAMKTMASKTNDRIRGIAMAVEGGGGNGSVSNATGGGGSGGGGYGGFNFRMPRQGGAAGVKGVSGLSKQLGNDKIGIASDDIFEMIHNRYQERDKSGSFQKQ